MQHTNIPEIEGFPFALDLTAAHRNVSIALDMRMADTFGDKSVWMILAPDHQVAQILPQEDQDRHRNNNGEWLFGRRFRFIVEGALFLPAEARLPWLLKGEIAAPANPGGRWKIEIRCDFREQFGRLRYIGPATVTTPN